MWQSSGRYSDLYMYDATFAFLHTSEFFNFSERFAYPAPTAIPYLFFQYFGASRMIVFIGLTLLLAIVAGVLFSKSLVRNGVSKAKAALVTTLCVLTSWPLLFLIQRANVELVLLYFTLGGALAYWTGYPKIAAFLWGLAASMKIYPILLLGMFLNRKQLKDLALGIATFAMSLLLSFLYIGPTIAEAAIGTLHGITGFVGSYAEQARELELSYDHSFLGAIKGVLCLRVFHLQLNFSPITHAYILLAAAARITLYFLRIRHLPSFNQFAIFSAAMIALPPVSYDYTLCHLYPTFGLLALAAARTFRRDCELPGLRTLLACFAILFTSQTYIHFHVYLPPLNGMIKALTLLVVLVTLMRHPIADEWVSLRSLD